MYSPFDQLVVPGSDSFSLNIISGRLEDSGEVPVNRLSFLLDDHIFSLTHPCSVIDLIKLSILRTNFSNSYILNNRRFTLFIETSKKSQRKTFEKGGGETGHVIYVYILKIIKTLPISGLATTTSIYKNRANPIAKLN